MPNLQKKDKLAGLIKKMFVKHKIQYPLQSDTKQYRSPVQKNKNQLSILFQFWTISQQKGDRFIS